LVLVAGTKYEIQDFPLFPADATPFQPGTERALTLTSDLFLRFKSFSSGTIH